MLSVFDKFYREYFVSLEQDAESLVIVHRCDPSSRLPNEAAAVAVKVLSLELVAIHLEFSLSNLLYEMKPISF